MTLEVEGMNELHVVVLMGYDGGILAGPIAVGSLSRPVEFPPCVGDSLATHVIVDGRIVKFAHPIQMRCGELPVTLRVSLK